MVSTHSGTSLSDQGPGAGGGRSGGPASWSSPGRKRGRTRGRSPPSTAALNAGTLHGSYEHNSSFSWFSAWLHVAPWAELWALQEFEKQNAALFPTYGQKRNKELLILKLLPSSQPNQSQPRPNRAAAWIFIINGRSWGRDGADAPT